MWVQHHTKEDDVITETKFYFDFELQPGQLRIAVWKMETLNHESQEG